MPSAEIEAQRNAARLLCTEALSNQANVTHGYGVALDTILRQLLDDLDPFWVRWRYVAEQRGWRHT